MTFDDIERLTRKTLIKTRALRIPVDVALVAHRLGLHVEQADLPAEVSGFLTLRGKRGTIVYNETHPRVRQRFTIAHEIGHYVMHRDQSDLFIDKRYPLWLRDTNASTGERLQEIQANHFAATLLMPRTAVEEAYSGLEYDLDLDDEDRLDELARSFAVSNQALSIRLSRVFGRTA